MPFLPSGGSIIVTKLQGHHFHTAFARLRKAFHWSESSICSAWETTWIVATYHCNWVKFSGLGLRSQFFSCCWVPMITERSPTLDWGNHRRLHPNSVKLRPEAKVTGIWNLLFWVQNTLATCWYCTCCISIVFSSNFAPLLKRTWVLGNLCRIRLFEVLFYQEIEIFVAEIGNSFSFLLNFAQGGVFASRSISQRNRPPDSLL